MNKLGVVFLLSLLGSTITSNGQSAASSATVIKNADIGAASNQLRARAVADSALKVVSVDGKYNLGISVVSRSKVNGKSAPDAISHDLVTEVYHILEGRGILVIGGTLDSSYQLPASSPVVQKVTGPSSMGRKINGGTEYQVGPGDIIVIPANTPHGFRNLLTDTIVYSLVRVDTEKVLQVR